MPNSNSTRYPIVAVPVSVFNALATQVEGQHDFGRILSVNVLVQEALSNSPMYDTLLVRVPSGWDGTTELPKEFRNFIGSKEPIKRVRVTKSQYEMLRIRQEQYASDGFRVELSCIVTAMLYQWSSEVREALEGQPNQILGLQIRGGEARPVKLAFWWEGALRSWKRDADLSAGDVIVGWEPA